jgi:Fe-S oxidoreductase
VLSAQQTLLSAISLLNDADLEVQLPSDVLDCLALALDDLEDATKLVQERYNTLFEKMGL